jgi:hypothetical protein
VPTAPPKEGEKNVKATAPSQEKVTDQLIYYVFMINYYSLGNIQESSFLT